jgi:hypothetical protein
LEKKVAINVTIAMLIFDRLYGFVKRHRKHEVQKKSTAKPKSVRLDLPVRKRNK